VEGELAGAGDRRVKGQQRGPGGAEAAHGLGADHGLLAVNAAALELPDAPAKAGARGLDVGDVEGVELELAPEVAQGEDRVVGDERQHPGGAQRLPRQRSSTRAAAFSGRVSLAST